MAPRASLRQRLLAHMHHPCVPKPSAADYLNTMYEVYVNLTHMAKLAESDLVLARTVFAVREILRCLEHVFDKPALFILQALSKTNNPDVRVIRNLVTGLLNRDEARRTLKITPAEEKIFATTLTAENLSAFALIGVYIPMADYSLDNAKIVAGINPNIAHRLIHDILVHPGHKLRSHVNVIAEVALVANPKVYASMRPEVRACRELAYRCIDSLEIRLFTAPSSLRTDKDFVLTLFDKFLTRLLKDSDNSDNYEAVLNLVEDADPNIILRQDTQRRLTRLYGAEITGVIVTHCIGFTGIFRPVILNTEQREVARKLGINVGRPSRRQYQNRAARLSAHITA